jgi:hypothetical protein
VAAALRAGELDACVELLKRIEAEGVTVIALTCDNTTGRFSETFLRTRPKELTQCQACHTGGFEDGRHRPLTEGIDMRGARRINPAWTGVSSSVCATTGMASSSSRASCRRS